MAKNAWIKGITNALKEFGNLQGERTKIMAGLAANQLEAKQNLFYKMQAAKQEQDMAWQNKLKEFQWMKQNYPGARIAPSGVNIPTAKEGLEEKIYAGTATPEEEELYRKGKAIDRVEPEIQKFRSDLQRAKAGEVTWDELKEIYPEPSRQEIIEKVRRSTLPELKRSPQFRQGKGLPAYFSKDIANLSGKTMVVIKNIKNQEDLDELIEMRPAYEEKGVDVNGILEYFGQR